MMLGIKLYKRIREKSDWEKTEKEVLNSINSKKEIEKNIHQQIFNTKLNAITTYCM